MKYDFIAIGDMVVDAFIRLKDASVHCLQNGGTHCELCMRFGDKIPYEELYVVPAVGNSANAAVSAARLGLKSALLAHVGGDQFGKDCLASLEKDGVATEFVQVHENMKTNYHFVLWFNDDRTILIKHQEYPYNLPDVDSPGWIYLSSLGSNSLPFHEEILRFLDAHSEIKLAFQPGTFQMSLGKEKLAGFYKRSDIFFCNKEESQRILGVTDEDIKKLLGMMKDLGPKRVVITDGPEGAYAHDGSEIIFLPPYPDPKPPFERTGAGDAFSSATAVALALGEDLKTALMWGAVNAMAVVQKVGAQAGLLTRVELEDFIKKAPASFVPKVLQ